MAKILSMPAGGSHPWVTTGLTFSAGRCSYVSGGYYAHDGICEVDLTVQITGTAGSDSDWAIVTGFIAPTADTTMAYTGGTNVTNAFIHTSGQLRVYPRYTNGDTMTFTGAYTY